MIHPLHRVTGFELIGPYQLRVAFQDGSQRDINFEPILTGSFYGPLRDQDLFSQVFIDPDAHTLAWPNGADFDPATLHDWPTFLPAMAERARQWADGSQAAALLKTATP